jgi:ENTS family enterobactin (siderophore) exporter
VSSAEPGTTQGTLPARGLETAVVGGGPAEVAPSAVAAERDLAPSTAPAAVDATAVPSIGLWQNRDFKVVLVGQGISAFGDAITFTALPLLVVLLTGSGLAMGTVGVLQTLPDLVLGLPAGALADRWDRRRMMLWSDVGRALLTALIPLSFLVGLPTMGVILLVTAPINALRVVFMSAYTAAVPNLAGPGQVGRANGYSEAIFSLSFIVGPAIAGVLVAIIGAGPTLAIDAVSFLVSALSLSLVRRPLQGQRARVQTHIVEQILEGLRYIRGEKTLRTVIAFWGLVSVSSAPLVPAVIFLLSVDRHLPPGVIGFVISGYGVGYLLGAVLAGRFSTGRLGLFMLSANVGSALFLALFALVDSPAVQAVGAFGAGLTGALVLISYITLRATIPPDELLGRVGSTARTISLGLSPIGLFSGGVLLDYIGGARTMLLISFALVLVSVVFALSGTMRAARQP